MKLIARLMLLAALPLTAATGAAQAVEFKSVGAAPALLYDAPSSRGRKVFVAPRNMPVEVIFVYNEWSKVRDAGGDLAWVESKMLAPRRNVVVTVANAKVYKSAADDSMLEFTASKNVLLELLEPVASGWAKVRSNDGQSGYVKVVEVWGD